MHQHLIAGYDGSSVSEAAARWAADEADRRGVGLTIVGCFVEPVMTDFGLGDRVFGIREIEQLREVTQRKLDHVVADLRTAYPAVVVTGCAVHGHARQVLAEQAEHADLLVLGSSGHGESARYLLGSLAHAMIRHSPCPVVLVAGDRPVQQRPRVVVAVDGTTESDAALAWACDEADLVGARLTVVHVWSYPYGDEDTPNQGRDLTRVDAALHLDRAVERARELTGGDVEARLLEGNVTTDVAHSAFDADLVVVGSVRRPRAFQLIPTRSITDAVIAHAPCPVVVVADGEAV